LDWEIVLWSIGIGAPAIVAGSFLSHYVGDQTVARCDGRSSARLRTLLSALSQGPIARQSRCSNPEGLRPHISPSSLRPPRLSGFRPERNGEILHGTLGGSVTTN
jgi:hypothetical protein